MNQKKIFFLLALVVFHAAAEDLSPEGWTAAGDKSDFSVQKDEKSLTLKRNKSGYYLRAYRDLVVPSRAQIIFQSRVKVEGSGSASLSAIFAKADGSWDEKKSVRSEKKILEKDGETQAGLTLSIPEGCTKVRINLILDGASAGAIFSGLRFEERASLGDVGIPEVSAAPELDGKIEDAVWKNALRLESFRVVGDPEKKSALRSEVLLIKKGDNLYIAFRAEEPDTAHLKTTARTNDASVSQDDDFEIFLSPNRKAYSHIGVNPAGFHFWNKNRYVRERKVWFPVITQTAPSENWQARAAIGAKEWTAEIQLRLSDVLEGENGDEKKLFANFARHRNAGEEAYANWAGTPGKSLHNPKDFLELPIRIGKSVGESSSGAKQPLDLSFSQRLAVPDLYLTAKPVKVFSLNGEFKLPADLRVTTEGFSIDSQILGDLKKVFSEGGAPSAELKIEKSGDPFSKETASLSVDERKILESPEAFRLEFGGSQIKITAKTFEGAHRGIATLLVLGKRARYVKDFTVPATAILDAPRLPFRAWLTDARGTAESLRWRVDLAYQFRYAQVFVMLDYAYAGTNSFFPFDSHPHIGDPSRTKKEWIDLFNYIRARGMEPIPFFTSFSRVRFIVNKSDYKDFAVRPDLLEGTKMKTHRNLDVANPEAVKLVTDLQGEIIDTLSAKGFHIGMDELHYDDLVTSKWAKEKKWKPSDWVIEALSRDSEFFRKKNVAMYLWGDMFDPGHNGNNMDISGPEILSKFPKDAIVMDWKYIRFDMAEAYPFVKTIKDAGLRAIGCPWYNPHNIALMTQTVYDNRAEGVCVTTWYPVEKENVHPELIRSIPLGAALAWQAEETQLGKLASLPDFAFKLATWQTNLALGPAKKIDYAEGPTGLASGPALRSQLGLPDDLGLGFLKTPFSNFRGVNFRLFQKNGESAGLVLEGVERVRLMNGDFSEGLKNWEVQNPSPNDAAVISGSEGLVISRKSSGYFLRAYQDLKLAPGKEYRLKFKSRASAGGYASVWIQLADGKGKWDEDLAVKSSPLKGEAWADGELRFSVKAPVMMARINLSVDGKDASASFRDLILDESLGGKATIVSAVPIAIGKKGRLLHFVHTLNKQGLSDDLSPKQIETEYSGFSAGTYEIRYEDGTSAQVPLSFRSSIVDWENRYPGRDQETGLYGTLGGKYFVNFPVYSWVNPFPEKTIREIGVLPGNRLDTKLVVLGVTLEN